MASSHTTTTTFHHSPTYGSDPTTPNTTFVQADPSTFRAVVQKLTGASDDPSAHKLPLTLPSRLAAATHKPTTSSSGAAEIGPKKPSFKLHERRQAAKKMELSIGVSERPIFNISSPNPGPSPSSSSSSPYYVRNRGGFMGFGVEMMMGMASPVSPLEILARGSPRTPREEEERAIAEKGFYLHPSPLSTPRASQPPELLPLFPLHSPTQNNQPTSS